MAYAPTYLVPVFPPSAHGTPLNQVPGGVPLPASPFGHHELLPGSAYAAPYFRTAPSALYGTSAAQAAGHQPGYYGGASQLHGLLHFSARNPRLRFDLAAPLEAVRHADGLHIPEMEEMASACLPESRILRIVCAQLPWVIDVNTSDEGANYMRPVTVGDVLQRIHAELRVRVTGPEYLIADKRKREAVAAAFRKRGDAAGKEEYDEGIKRVDWLGDARHFMGLTKDDRVVKEVLQGRADQVPETWVMIVGSR